MNDRIDWDIGYDKLLGDLNWDDDEKSNCFDEGLLKIFNYIII